MVQPRRSATGFVARRRRAQRARLMAFRRRVVRARGGPLVHRFKEWYDGGGITVGAATSQGFVLSTQIASLVNWSGYKGLFDLYKITGMKFTLIPSHNVSDFSAGTGSGTPMLYIAPNRDPYVPSPTSVGDILNDDGVKIIRFTKPVSFYLKNPKPDILDGDSKSIPWQFNSSNTALQPWLTTGGNLQTVTQEFIKHYGFRYFVDNTINTAQPFTFTTYVKLYFSMKEQD